MDLFKKAIEENDVNLLVSTRQSKNVNKMERDSLNFGERLADKITDFNGSWAFIILYIAVIILWCSLNIGFLFLAFDPYPFIFLNLVLAILTAIQAPFIMMSQKRQSKKDSLMAENDYKLNLKNELVQEEIMRCLTKVEENQEVIIGNQIKIMNTLPKSKLEEDFKIDI